MMNLFKSYENCQLCPRQCGVDRTRKNSRGFCGESDRLRVGYIGPHFGEEPPISGTHGSGTVFLTGCSLKCAFCQNHQISLEGRGESLSRGEFVTKLEDLIFHQQVHNINFVTPDHFFPHLFEAIGILKEMGLDTPMLFNTSGYQSLEMLKYAEGFADIYLPDFKYADENLAESLSRCRNYPTVALAALTEMIRQKGFLDVFETGEEVSKKGVLVRHLILPGNVGNSILALTTLFLEFGKKLPISLMSQYSPVRRYKETALNRRLTHEEFTAVYDHVQDLGFENLFVQFLPEPSGDDSENTRFLPDFQKSSPFNS
ncbi:MAG: radical SAM protein [Proteobacteria bacterium]|nr:radical SAM protein [Pseudomonadota bacterium]MBU4469233.1 radical SAM protein [Pseudomonadota bacterium]MCG2752264.1 radical SAM protein [Desulfobacteraceae bacterium]